MEVDSKDESTDEDDDEEESADEEEDEDENVDEDDVVCPMEDCESKTIIQGKNLTRIVGDLRLKVPCKNRDAGCMHKGVEDEMEEHEDECGDRKIQCDYDDCEDIPFKDLLHHLKCSITSRMNMNWILTARSGISITRLNQLEKMSLLAMRAPTCLRLVWMDWCS